MKYSITLFLNIFSSFCSLEAVAPQEYSHIYLLLFLIINFGPIFFFASTLISVYLDYAKRQLA